jgi:hypothetical protein
MNLASAPHHTCFLHPSLTFTNCDPGIDHQQHSRKESIIREDIQDTSTTVTRSTSWSTTTSHKDRAIDDLLERHDRNTKRVAVEGIQRQPKIPQHSRSYEEPIYTSVSPSVQSRSHQPSACLPTQHPPDNHNRCGEQNRDHLF